MVRNRRSGQRERRGEIAHTDLPAGRRGDHRQQLQPDRITERLESGCQAARSWGHVRLFSPWRFNIDAAAARLLGDAGWVRPDDDKLPTSAELAADYLQLLADLPVIKPHIRYGARVGAVTRLGLDRIRTKDREQTPFLVRLDDGEDILARSVIDASGTWGTPNVLGASGIPAHGEAAAAGYVDSALPDVRGRGRDRDRFAGRRILVVGAGHSAANTLLALAELADQEPGTAVTWAIRATGINRAATRAAQAVFRPSPAQPSRRDRPCPGGSRSPAHVAAVRAV